MKKIFLFSFLIGFICLLGCFEENGVGPEKTPAPTITPTPTPDETPAPTPTPSKTPVIKTVEKPNLSAYDFEKFLLVDLVVDKNDVVSPAGLREIKIFDYAPRCFVEIEKEREVLSEHEWEFRIIDKNQEIIWSESFPLYFTRAGPPVGDEEIELYELNYESVCYGFAFNPDIYAVQLLKEGKILFEERIGLLDPPLIQGSVVDKKGTAVAGKELFVFESGEDLEKIESLEKVYEIFMDFNCISLPVTNEKGEFGIETCFNPEDELQKIVPGNYWIYFRPSDELFTDETEALNYWKTPEARFKLEENEIKEISFFLEYSKLNNEI